MQSLVIKLKSYGIRPRSEIYMIQMDFKRKLNQDGYMYMFKVRLVAEDYIQKDCIDYSDSHASILGLIL